MRIRNPSYGKRRSSHLAFQPPQLILSCPANAFRLPVICAHPLGSMSGRLFRNMKEVAVDTVGAVTVTQRRQRVVALSAALSLICTFCAFWIWFPSWEYSSRFFGLVCILPFLLPYGFILFRLQTGKLKNALSLAIAMGCALFVPGIYLLRFVVEWPQSWWVRTNICYSAADTAGLGCRGGLDLPLSATRAPRLAQATWQRHLRSFPLRTFLGGLRSGSSPHP